MADAPVDPEANRKKLKVIRQYYAGFIVNLGALAIGMLIGWSSPAESCLVDEIQATSYQISWISSIMTLGAAASQIFVALLFLRFSLKILIIGMSIGLIGAWIVIEFANGVDLYYVGRFFTGFFAGSYCATVPIYVAEIAHKSIRGTLGIMFQIMIVTGILLSFSLGELKSLHWMNIPAMIPAAALIIPLCFLPVSPVYYIEKGQEDKARKSLQYYRGKTYDIEPELAELKGYSNAMKNEPIKMSLKQRASIRAIMILAVLHIVQQLSGINAFMFYASTIFEKAGSSLSPGVSAIIMAVVQLLVTGLAAYLVDKIGRRWLWIISLLILASSNIALGVYVLIDNQNSESVDPVRFLPIVILSIYIIGFSLGCGPLPWMMLGEMVPNRIKFIVNTGISCLNWIMAFVVTVSFKKLTEWVGDYTVFFIFGSICILGTLFVIFFTVETKNKTLEEIQASLSKKYIANRTIRNTEG